MTLAERYNLATNRVARFLHVVWITALVVSIALLFVGSAVPGTGGPAFRWALVATGQDSLVFAASAGLWLLFEGTLACAIVLWVFAFVLRRAVLFRTDPMTGVVIDARQTGATVNNRPVIIVRVRIEMQTGPVITTSRKLFDLGSIPRAGDHVWLEVSRLDPSTSAYCGPV